MEFEKDDIAAVVMASGISINVGIGSITTGSSLSGGFWKSSLFN